MKEMNLALVYVRIVMWLYSGIPNGDLISIILIEVFLHVKLNVRSIQIGLRNQAVSMLLDPSFVLNIRDVTANFRAVCACLQNNKDELGAKSALFPDEQECLVEITDAELRKPLGMDLQ